MPYHTGMKKKKKKPSVNLRFTQVLMQMRGLYESTKNVEELTARRLNVARSSGGLTRWFKENWVDVKTGKPCGRKKGEKRGYPACRPSKRVSSKTPKTTGEMSASEKARFKREKTGSKKITYQHRRKKRKKRS